MNYNLGVLRKLAIFGTCIGFLASLGAVGSVAALGGGCKKNAGGSEGNTDLDNKAIAKTFDDSEPPPAERKPIEGVDLGDLNEGAKKRFETLVDKLASPCGKAHSLRTSKNTDESCIRAPFAVRYVAQMLRDGFTDKEVVKWYGAVYTPAEAEQGQPRGFKLDGVPHTGPTDALVTLVEFYDYGCPACKAFAPEVDTAVRAFPQDAALYYKMFPLSVHPDSGPAAQAALAAAAQGKFHEMHAVLFQNSPQHKLPSLTGYAQSLGLDMEKFMTDYAAAAAKVAADKEEGIAAKVSHTPTTFINGVPYNGLNGADYLKIAIEESIALKR